MEPSTARRSGRTTSTASRGAFYYSRYGNPTVAEAERALGELDGGDGAALPVGRRRDDRARARAAEARRHDRARRGLLLRHGRARSRRSRAGACATSSSTRPAPPPDGVQLVWLEAPSNPFLTMPDLEAAAAHPAPVVVDSTAATPVHLRPLEHGADFVAAQRDEVPRAATTTRCSARSSAATRGAPSELADVPRRAPGSSPRPTPAWLLLRGLKTLEVRVRRQTETAAALAERLRGASRRSRPCATPASAACSRSTSRTATPPGASRPRRA